MAMAAEDQASIRDRIETLTLEHRDLDDVIARLAEDAHVDHLRLQRLKKKKLQLKDDIERLRNQLNGSG